MKWAISIIMKCSIQIFVISNRDEYRFICNKTKYKCVLNFRWHNLITLTYLAIVKQYIRISSDIPFEWRDSILFLDPSEMHKHKLSIWNCKYLNLEKNKDDWELNRERKNERLKHIIQVESFNYLEPFRRRLNSFTLMIKNSIR